MIPANFVKESLFSIRLRRNVYAKKGISSKATNALLNVEISSSMTAKAKIVRIAPTIVNLALILILA